VLVEDSETDVFLVNEAIAAHHLDVDLQVVTDGEQAIRVIARIDADENVPCPQLFLLDLNIPRTSGFEVLARLRGSQRCALVPVIVMTSSAALTDRTTATALRADAYFQKPPSYDAFLKLGALAQRMLGEQR